MAPKKTTVALALAASSAFATSTPCGSFSASYCPTSDCCLVTMAEHPRCQDPSDFPGGVCPVPRRLLQNDEELNKLLGIHRKLTSSASCSSSEVVCTKEIQAAGDNCSLGSCTPCTSFLQASGVNCAIGDNQQEMPSAVFPSIVGYGFGGRRLTSCEGDVFVVQPGDSCSAYTNTCAGWTSVQCTGVGTTCANGNDQLWAGDTCTFVYGTARRLARTKQSLRSRLGLQA